MTARQIPLDDLTIAERIEPYTTRRPMAPVSLGVCVARMRAAVDEFDHAWRQAIELMAPPFVTDSRLDDILNDAEETHRYDADEDMWGGHDDNPA